MDQFLACRLRDGQGVTSQQRCWVFRLLTPEWAGGAASQGRGAAGAQLLLSAGWNQRLRASFWACYIYGWVQE